MWRKTNFGEELTHEAGCQPDEVATRGRITDSVRLNGEDDVSTTRSKMRACAAHEVRENRARELIDENHDIASATKHRRDRHAHDISVNHVEREPSGARVRHAVRAVTGVDMRAGRLGGAASIVYSGECFRKCRVP